MADEVQQIKDRLNIVDVVGQYVQLKKAGRNYSGRCPFHKERTPSFMVSPERGTYMCFGCGEKGDIFSFVERMDGIDFKTVLHQLAERAGVTLPKYQGPTPEKKEKDERLREACEAATKYFESELHRRADVQTYLRDRGMKDETRTAWRVGYAPASWENLSQHLSAQGFSKDDIADAGLAAKSAKTSGGAGSSPDASQSEASRENTRIYDRFRGRIMFPIFDAGGAVIAFSGRFFEKVPGSHEEGEPAKYVNSPETELFKKSRTLYGLDRAKHAIRKTDCILLVEGQFDVVLSHQSGLSFAVAISGTALTPEHLSILGRLSKRLVLSLDNDEAGIRAGLKSAQMALAAGFDVKIPKIEGGKDPADLAAKDPELLRAAVRESAPAITFFLEALRAGTKGERAYQKVIEAQVVPLIAAIPSKIDQEHFIRIVAKALMVPESAVREEAAKAAKRGGGAYQETSPAARAYDGVPEALAPIERAAGMLLFRFGADSATGGRLTELIGRERLEELEERLQPQAEELRFLFDSEAGRGAEEQEIINDLLRAIERTTVQEELGREKDPKKIADLARRLDALRT